MARAPRDKHDHNARYLRFEFGNRPRAWKSLDDLLADGYNGLVSIRNMVPHGGFVSHYPVDQLRRGWWPAPFPKSAARFNESMPDEALVLQGNVRPSTDPGGLWLEYSTTPCLTHRQFTQQLTQSMQVSGLHALGLLRRHLWPGDYDWMQELMTRYPDAESIEFSAYSKAVGEWPNSNTVIWEVRAF